VIKPSTVADCEVRGLRNGAKDLPRQDAELEEESIHR